MTNGHTVSSGSSSSSEKVPKKVLVVDDESVIRHALRKFLDEEGFVSAAAGSSLKALKAIEEDEPDIVILDIQLPDTNGLLLLSTIKETYPHITVIMMTGHADVRGAVDAMKMGALDYLEKPIDFGALRSLLQKTVSSEESQRKEDFIFQSEKMSELFRVAERLATKSDVTVLVLGESGTGKNFLCRRMHDLSPRRGNPFVEVGCSNIPDNLIESELFGYEKGAFTDAKAGKQGLIELADGGTVFLDEIGDMPYPMQSKILSLIEEKKFRRIGGLSSVRADVRIFAATNRDLHQLVQEKKFRLDLYYRLNVATIEMPALRDRKGDIPALAEHFLKHYVGKYQCGPRRMSERAMSIFMHYSWPGNVRELKNLLERAVILSRHEEIDLDDLPASIVVREEHAFRESEAAAPPPASEPSSGLSLGAMEEEFIREALKVAGGNQRKAAKLLNITKDTLRYRLKKLGIDSSEYKEDE